MIKIICAVFIIWILFSCVAVDHRHYQGKPYGDTAYAGGPQKIPGKLQCEYYDQGGEGVAFHDQDSINSGSGRLNPDDGTYLNTFRIKEAVDISYTKARNIDDNPFNFVEPQLEQLYVGWTEPGEWLNYTVEVQAAGTYRIGIMYTANDDGQISLSINDENMTGPLDVTSTYVAADTVNWRQWHHWNYLDSIGNIAFKKGRQKLTLHTVTRGQMNYDFIVFTRKDD